MLVFVFGLWKHCKFDVVWYVDGTGSQPALNTLVVFTVDLVLNSAISWLSYESSQPYTPTRRYL
jgi:hypothetical protein